MAAWGVGKEESDRERRLALLLADGTGDFDFVRVFAIQTWVVLEGHVKAYRDKERAEELARHVGFEAIANTIRVHPDSTKLGGTAVPMPSSAFSQNDQR
jgi:hypothetical protein